MSTQKLRLEENEIIALRKILFTVARGETTEDNIEQQPIEAARGFVDRIEKLEEENERLREELEAVKAVRRFCKRGVNRNIKFVAITQDPTAYDKRALRQSEYRLIFDMANENPKSSVLRKMGFDWNAVDATPDRYTGVLHDDSRTVLEEQVKVEAEYA